MGEVIITAGGTREKIDDVRYVGNFSGGRLGHRIAEVYGKWTDDNVTLLAPQATIDRYGLPKNVTHEPFVTSRDLREKLLGIKAADIVFHSAAVSDYIPEFHSGKISSDNEELTMSLKKNPKIISELRGHFGEKTKLIGFKLLSGASDEQLHAAAIKQIADNDLDYCIANDLQKITKEQREVHIIQKPRASRNGSSPKGWTAPSWEWNVLNASNDLVGERIVQHFSQEANWKIGSQPYEVEFGGRKFWVDPRDY